MPNQLSSTPHFRSEDLFKAWMDGLAEVSSSPKLMLQIERENEKLLPRFAERYERLKALPRTVRRAMQKKWKHSLAGIALLMALGGGSASATTFNIPCDNGVGDSGALIQAINDSNDEVTNPGEDTINLGSNCVHNLTSAYDSVYGATGLPLISSIITIDGNGSTIRRDDGMGIPDFRIITVDGYGDLTLREAIITGGVSETFGGGLANAGILTVIDSTVTGNSAVNGGGLAGGGTLINSTVSGNFASENGGGLSGGGTLVNCTVTGNVASLKGGGLYMNYASATLDRSIVSGNTARLTRHEIDRNCYYSTLNINNFNLFGHNGFAGFSFCDTPGPTDIVPDVPLNAILSNELADNGGSTPTHALLFGSPAVDAVETGCPPPAQDQRGVSRPQLARCDIGSFELSSSVPPPPPDPSGGNGGCSIAHVSEKQQTPLYLLIPLFMLIKRVWKKYRTNDKTYQ